VQSKANAGEALAGRPKQQAALLGDKKREKQLYENSVILKGKEAVKLKRDI
jgi:hypothetical protein